MQNIALVLALILVALALALACSSESHRLVLSNSLNDLQNTSRDSHLLKLFPSRVESFDASFVEDRNRGARRRERGEALACSRSRNCALRSRRLRIGAQHTIFHPCVASISAFCHCGEIGRLEQYFSSFGLTLRHMSRSCGQSPATLPSAHVACSFTSQRAV